MREERLREERMREERMRGGEEDQAREQRVLEGGK